MALNYKNFNDNYFHVNCDKRKYQDFFTQIGAKKCADGFIVPKDKELQLQKIIDFINMKDNSKSRKEQSKYHREHSDNEEEVSKKTVVGTNAKYKNSDPQTYYKSFNTKPVDFKKIHRYDTENESDEEYSSSSHNSSSTDNFPSPSTPGNKHRQELNEIYECISEMQKRIKNLEMK